MSGSFFIMPCPFKIVHRCVLNKITFFKVLPRGDCPHIELKMTINWHQLRRHFGTQSGRKRESQPAGIYCTNNNGKYLARNCKWIAVFRTRTRDFSPIRIRTRTLKNLDPGPTVFCFNLLKKYKQQLIQMFKNKVASFLNKLSLFNILSHFITI